MADHLIVPLVIFGGLLLGVCVRRPVWLISIVVSFWVVYSILDHCGKWLGSCLASENHSSWLLIVVPYVSLTLSTLTLVAALLGWGFMMLLKRVLRGLVKAFGTSNQEHK
ncbi:MAG: hypothetical protein JNM76_07290 [Betaproteobacteria bacterium]|nr:hypothetical protein [Betaproteobacteria bacterium]